MFRKSFINPQSLLRQNKESAYNERYKDKDKDRINVKDTLPKSEANPPSQEDQSKCIIF